ncbi:MAG: GtrA family protein [Selenomonadaceae bacterium]
MHLFKKLQQHFFTREFLFFLCMGCINTFNCSLIAAFFTYWLTDANAAFNIGYLLSLTFAYYLNSKIVFKQRLNKAQYLRFCLSYLPNFLVQNLIVVFFYNMLAFPPIISYLFAAIIGVPVTFLLVKIFAFRQ